MQYDHYGTQSVRKNNEEEGRFLTLGVDDFDAREIVDEMEELSRTTSNDFDSNRYLRSTFGDATVNRVRQQQLYPLH